MKSRSYTGWSLKEPKGGLIAPGGFLTRKELIHHFTGGGSPKSMTWAETKKAGYRAVKVQVTEVKPKIFI